MRRLMILVALVACDDGGDFDNPCDPANLDQGRCGDAAPPDQALPDSAEPDAHIPDTAAPDRPIPDVAPPDAAPPDMALPDTALPDMALPDVGPDAAPLPSVEGDRICGPDEVPASPDCLVSDCNIDGCTDALQCDPESGQCATPGACANDGCPDGRACAESGQCVENCWLAGCAPGRRCALDTGRCVPAETPCGTPDHDPTCRDAQDEETCVARGGVWAEFFIGGEFSCDCPTRDAHCPCNDFADCETNCFVPPNPGNDGCSEAPARCAPRTIDNGCFCDAAGEGLACP